MLDHQAKHFFLLQVLLQIKASTTLAEHEAGPDSLSEQAFANPRQLLSQCIDPPQTSNLHDAFLELLHVEALSLPETASVELTEILQAFLKVGPPMVSSKGAKEKKVGNLVNTDTLDMLLHYCVVTNSGKFFHSCRWAFLMESRLSWLPG